MVWMTVVAENLWSTIRLTRAAPNAIQVEVTGIQFQWYFRHPGPDRRYGAIKPNLVDAAGGNPLGLDPADPHIHDDIVSSVLELPVNQQAEIRLRAQDVIHGFFIPGMRVMQNATPGMPSQIAYSHGRLCNSLFATMWSGALSNACCPARRFATGFRDMDGATPNREQGEVARDECSPS
jgi:heme/copper-type cytochrome/quinol oxidase subunit 2